MSGFGSFLKRHRVVIIVPTLLAGEFYLWWKIQQMENLVPADERKELFVKPFEYAQRLYGKSTSGDHHSKDKSL